MRFTVLKLETWPTTMSLEILSGSMQSSGLYSSVSTKLGITVISCVIPRLFLASSAMNRETAVTASAASTEYLFTGSYAGSLPSMVTSEPWRVTT